MYEQLLRKQLLRPDPVVLTCRGCTISATSRVSSTKEMSSTEPSSSRTPRSQSSEEQHDSQELFQIIDETGEGFGFDLTPQALAKPLAIGTAALFSVGMLAGVPFGLALGRVQEDAKRGKVTPSLAGVKFAATTFGLGTLLCASMGVTAFYGVKKYYHVETFEEFGHIMRRDVPHTRQKMENGLAPLLECVQRNAGESLPEPMRRLQSRFLQSGIGKWIKNQADSSVNVDGDPEAKDNSSAT